MIVLPLELLASALQCWLSSPVRDEKEGDERIQRRDAVHLKYSKGDELLMSSARLTTPIRTLAFTTQFPTLYY